MVGAETLRSGENTRLLAGGAPSNPDPRVLRALTTPLIGQFDPAFTALMDEVQELGRRAFQASSARCVPVSGVAVAALEAVLNTLLEPGDRVVVGGGPGRFGQTVAGLAERYGARVEVLTGGQTGTVSPKHVEVLSPSGQVDTLSPEDLRACLAREAARLVVVAHVDGQTGALRPLAGLAEVCHAHGALLLVDASLSLGGCELRFDAWGLDAAVAGLEVCLAGPAGLSLVVYSENEEAAFRGRRTPPRTSYLDLLQLQAYWSPERLNHHTAPTSLVYGAREALRLALVEGLETRWARHRRVNAGLRAGLAALGFSFRADPASQSSVLCVLQTMSGELRSMLRDQYGIALGADGQVALVGHNARTDRLLTLLAAIEQALGAMSRDITPGAARTAALAAL
jgi:aspartate aminotransferase-like enzyme